MAIVIEKAVKRVRSFCVTRVSIHFPPFNCPIAKRTEVSKAVHTSLDHFCVLICGALGFSLRHKAFEQSWVRLALVLCAAVMEPGLD